MARVGTLFPQAAKSFRIMRTEAMGPRLRGDDACVENDPYRDRLTASGEIFRGLGAARCPAAV
jgi:hypothetical protein